MKRNELEYELDAAGEEQLSAARSQGTIVKCIVIRCLQSKNVFAHCVPCKGADEEGYVADLVVKNLIWLGYTELIVKGDNEPALQALVQRAFSTFSESTLRLRRYLMNNHQRTTHRPMAESRSG